jgi:hypothetical protein
MNAPAKIDIFVSTIEGCFAMIIFKDGRIAMRIADGDTDPFQVVARVAL